MQERHDYRRNRQWEGLLALGSPCIQYYQWLSEPREYINFIWAIRPSWWCCAIPCVTRIKQVMESRCQELRVTSVSSFSCTDKRRYPKTSRYLQDVQEFRSSPNSWYFFKLWGSFSCRSIRLGQLKKWKGLPKCQKWILASPIIPSFHPSILPTPYRTKPNLVCPQGYKIPRRVNLLAKSCHRSIARFEGTQIT